MEREDLFSAYRLFFDRTPVKEAVIEEKLRNFRSVPELIQALAQSKEFNTPHCKRKLQANAVTEQLVVEAFRLILGRTPENPEVIEGKVKNVKSQWHLVTAMIKSKEFLRKLDLRDFVSSEKFNSTPKTVYLHIPKTAGKAFEKLAEQNYGDGCSLSTTGNFSREHWESAQLIGGHFFQSMYDSMHGQRIFLSVVRDPVDRAISRFNYYRDREAGYERRVERKFDHQSLKNTIRDSGFRREFIDNYQCLYLSGKHRYSSVRHAFSNDVFIVGSFDKIDQWLAFLSEKLSWQDSTLPQINVASDPGYMNEFKNDSELLDILVQNNEEDYKLVDFIRTEEVYCSAPPGFDFSPFKAQQN
ncbi:hypothetical protein EY643_00910 [Halioglobus maricola]|uniref:Sulfotransferase family protein n=1 Tax=Halioglobus maricola TaxID=2601894 RepID=A0A5P9NEZ2_9GAMM|nr:sulfotransferase family 2 domain-containing protein [Halioglobus maricola]QFU74321.1 hypothetical protein EY643_00910 [Halioglobus maricola]